MLLRGEARLRSGVPMRSRLLVSAIWLGFAVAILPTKAHAVPLDFSATLLGANAVPPNASTANGSALITLDLTTVTLDVSVSFSDLTSAATFAFLGCCALPGHAEFDAIPFTNFPNATSGTYTNTFDLTSALTYDPIFLSASGGAAINAFTVLESGLFGGEAYIEISDASFPDGEIRGQLELTSPTPLPASLPLFATGLGGLGLLGWRRKRRGMSFTMGGV
jgi:CHRD domain